MDSKRIKRIMMKNIRNEAARNSKRHSSSRIMMKKIKELSVQRKFDTIRDLLLERENHMKSEIDNLKTKAALFYRIGSNLGKKVRDLESQNLVLEQTNSMNLQTIEKLELQLFLQDDDKITYSSSSEGSINWCGKDELNEQPEVESSSSDDCQNGTTFTLRRILPENENITLKRKSPEEDGDKKKRQHIAIGWSWLDQLPSASESDSDSYTNNIMANTKAQRASIQ